LKVLVVDDESSMRFLLRMLLESDGFDVVEAAHGAEALAKVHQARPDLVVTDLMMPVMDGRGLIDRLRGDEETAGIPIVALSSRPNPSVPGADAVLEKPFGIQELPDAARALVGRGAA
jgi:CheY-like chemotaxis protein